MTETLRRGYPGMKVRVSRCLDAVCVRFCRSTASEHLLNAKSGLMGQLADREARIFDLLCTLNWTVELKIYHPTLSPAVMQSVKDMPVLQDGPPPGGFPSVRFARRIPSTGPTGFTLFALGAVAMAYGFVKVRFTLTLAELRRALHYTSASLAHL